jgi:hypothetical protein
MLVGRAVSGSMFAEFATIGVSGAERPIERTEQPPGTVGVPGAAVVAQRAVTAYPLAGRRRGMRP